MPEVIISARDAQKVSQISSQLPHALLVIADYGLDGLGVAQILAKNNDTFHLKPLPEKQTISIDQIRELISILLSLRHIWKSYNVHDQAASIVATLRREFVNNVDIAWRALPRPATP